MKYRTGLALTACTLALGGCAPDGRMPLSDCDHGLYWADCGGSGDPVLGCDRETGDCRWFSGGVTARGHAASDCRSDDPCCHGNWPFSDFTPSNSTRTYVVEQLSLLHPRVIQGDDLNLEPILRNAVSVDLGLTEMTTRGTVRFSDCCSFSSTVQPVRVGNSVVVTYRAGRDRYELEILVGDTLAEWSARLYLVREENREIPPAPLACGDYWATGVTYVVEGELHLNTDDLSDLDAFHGRLVATISRGGTRRDIEAMEF